MENIRRYTRKQLQRLTEQACCIEDVKVDDGEKAACGQKKPKNNELWSEKSEKTGNMGTTTPSSTT